MKYVGFALLAIVGVIVALLLIALIRTLFTKPKTSTYTPNPDPEKAREYAEKLSAMVQVNTVASNEDRRTEAFLDFHKVLAVFFFLVVADAAYHAEFLQGGRTLGGQQMQGLVRQDDVGRDGLLVGQTLTEDAEFFE